MSNTSALPLCGLWAFVVVKMVLIARLLPYTEKYRCENAKNHAPFGHIEIMADEKFTKQLYDSNVERSRHRGRPILTYHQIRLIAHCPKVMPKVFAIDVLVALPTSAPVLVADKDRYQPGEMLRANCTSPPARPPTNLTVYVNEEPVSALETSLHSSDTGLFTTKIKVELEVTSRLFPAGRLRVACYASMYDLFNKSAKLDFLTPETDPRPERITLNGGSNPWTGNQYLLLILLILPTIALRSCSDSDEANDQNEERQTKRIASPTQGG